MSLDIVALLVALNVAMLIAFGLLIADRMDLAKRIEALEDNK